MRSENCPTPSSSYNDSFDTIPQEILDHFTRFDMPSVKDVPPSEETMQVGDAIIPVYRCEPLVLGSGVAGMRAAVEAKRRSIAALPVDLTPEVTRKFFEKAGAHI